MILVSIESFSNDRYISNVLPIDTVIVVPFEDLYVQNIPVLGNENIYIITGNRVSKECNIFDINKLSTYKYTIVLDDYFKDIRDFAFFSNDTLVTINWNYALKIYSKVDSKFILSDNVQLERPFKYIRSIDNKRIILFESGIYGSNRTLKSHTHVGIITFLDDSVSVKCFDLPDPNSIQLSLFGPKKYIDCSNKFIVVSDIDNYVLKIYDYSSSLISTVCIDENINEKDVDISYKNITIPNSKEPYNAKYYLDKLRPHYNKINTIRRVDFLNDSTILICKRIKISDNYSFKFDIITIDDLGNINNKFLGFMDYIPNPDNKFIDENDLNIIADYKCLNNSLFYFQPIPISMYNNLTFQEVFDKIQEYYIKSENILQSLIIRKLTFNEE